MPEHKNTNPRAWQLGAMKRQLSRLFPIIWRPPPSKGVLVVMRILRHAARKAK